MGQADESRIGLRVGADTSVVNIVRVGADASVVNLVIGADIPVLMAAVAVPAGWFVTQFAGSIAKGLGDDTYRSLKKHIVSWWLARAKQEPGSAEHMDTLEQIAIDIEPELKGQARAVALPRALENPGNSALVVVGATLPREAFQALAAVDWSAQPDGTYRFNRNTGQWTTS